VGSASRTYLEYSSAALSPSCISGEPRRLQRVEPGFHELGSPQTLRPNCIVGSKGPNYIQLEAEGEGKKIGERRTRLFRVYIAEEYPDGPMLERSERLGWLIDNLRETLRCLKARPAHPTCLRYQMELDGT
jgi:hypothetical protein